MENKFHEAHETAEHGGHDPSLAPVTVTMAIIAVLVAGISLLGHRAHTETILAQSQASDQWAFYQAKSIRQHTYEVFVDLAAAEAAKGNAQAAEVQKKYSAEIARYTTEEKDIQTKAQELEKERDVQGHRADRFDLGEGLMEAALVMVSMTILTRRKGFWIAGG